MNTQNKIIKIFSDRAPEHQLNLMNSLAASQGLRALLAHLQLGTPQPGLEETLAPLTALWQKSREDRSVPWLNIPHLLIELVFRAAPSFFYRLGMIIKRLIRTFAQI